MKRQSLFLLVVFPSLTSFGQINFSMGLEGGLNSSGTPITERWTTSSGTKITEKEMPIIRPVVGIWSKMNVKKHFFISLGIQYHSIGLRYKRETHGYDNINNVNYDSYTFENFTFKKFSFPIIIGYDFRIKKLVANFFIGYRPLLYTNGSYSYKYDYTEDGGLRDRSSEKKIDPFDYTNLDIGAQKNQKQFLVGIGTPIKNNLHLSFFCAAYNKITFQEKLPPGQWDATGYVHEYSRWDLLLSLKYTLIQPGRH